MDQMGDVLSWEEKDWIRNNWEDYSGEHEDTEQDIVMLIKDSDGLLRRSDYDVVVNFLENEFGIDLQD